eukprot:GILJ01000432.1.p1 GENE.GILJ01000432.1~~GILJ01000432.1.p1  ORF type:complete len:610 (-),score=105.98 GILJ01000432.1:80-1882(-)
MAKKRSSLFACLLLCALLCGVALAACGDHDSCDSCIKDETCAWCGATKFCQTIADIPYKATNDNSKSLAHPYYDYFCGSNWRVEKSVWLSNKHAAINWATDEKCKNDEEEKYADQQQTLGFEAESRVLYQASGQDGAEKHDALFIDGRNQVTLDMTSQGERDIEFVMFPPVTISDNGFETLIKTTKSMGQVSHTIGEHTLEKYNELKSKNKLQTKTFDFTNGAYSPLRHQQAVEAELNLPWIEASKLKDELEGKFMNRFDFLKQRDDFLSLLQAEQDTDPVELSQATTDSVAKCEETANTVATGVQVTASIPLNRVLDLFSLPDKQFRVIGSESSSIYTIATCLKGNEELTAGWTTEFQGFMTLLTYYSASFHSFAINHPNANCQLINPKNDVLSFNIRSNFYDMIRAVKSFSYAKEADSFPVKTAQDLIGLVKEVEETCVPRKKSSSVCVFEEIKLGGHPVISKDGNFVTIGQWLTSIIEGPTDKLHDAHLSLAVFTTQFRGKSPAAIIEFRDPGIIASIPGGQLTTAMTVFFDFFKTFLSKQPVQPTVDAALQCYKTINEICNSHLLTRLFERLRVKPEPVQKPGKLKTLRNLFKAIH